MLHVLHPFSFFSSLFFFGWISREGTKPVAQRKLGYSTSTMRMGAAAAALPAALPAATTGRDHRLRPPAATTGCNHPPPPPVITGAHVRKFSVELHAGASHVLRPPSLRIARRSPSSSSLSVSVRPRFRWNRRDSKHAAAPPSRPAATARDRPTPPDIQMKPWGTRRGRLRPPLPVSFSCLCSPSLLLLASPLFQILLPFPNSPAPPPPSCAPYACWSSLTRMLRPSSSESWYAWMAASARSAVA